MDEDTLPSYSDQCLSLAKGIETSLAATGSVALDNTDWAVVLAALRGWLSTAATPSGGAFIERVAAIADDFHPDKDAEAPAALAEMREALMAAVEQQRASIPADQVDAAIQVLHGLGHDWVKLQAVSWTEKQRSIMRNVLAASATPSGPASVAVKEVERLLSDYGAAEYTAGYEAERGDNSAEKENAERIFCAIRDAVRRLVSPQDLGAPAGGSGVDVAAVRAAALEWYAEQFCEHGADNEVCGRLSDDDCSGCRARRALATHQPTKPQDAEAVASASDQPAPGSAGSEGGV